MTVVVFDKDFENYVAGDVAGFEQNKAVILIEKGIAHSFEVLEEKPKKKKQD